jgi:NADH:ubiquinone oxidoreductase subunit F (NADH-binding)
LATVSGAVRAPGVHEVPVGIPLTELLARTGMSGELRAALVGGYHGTWVSASDVAIPLSGKVIGAGVVVALDARHCGLEAAAEIVRYLARQSARQCGPCLNGLPALAQAMSALAAGGSPELPAELANLVDGRGACHHPDGVARFVRSALAAFEDDIAHHLRGDCTATMP